MTPDDHRPETRHPAAGIQDANILTSVSEVGLLDAMRLRLAVQSAPRRWQTGLQRMVEAVEQGVPLEQAMDQGYSKLPADLASLCEQALRVGDPTMLILAAVRTRARIQRGWQSFLHALAYPTIVFVSAVAIAVFISFAMQRLVDLVELDTIVFGSYSSLTFLLRDQHQAMVGLGLTTAWSILVAASIVAISPPWARLAVFGGLFVVGRPLRWTSLQELLLRLQLFIEHGLPPLEAARATAASFRHSPQSRAGWGLATRLEAGREIGQSLGDSGLSDSLCRPCLLLLDVPGAELPAALQRSASTLGRLVEQRRDQLVTVLPVLILLGVAGILWGAISSYVLVMLPMFQLIEALA